MQQRPMNLNIALILIVISGFASVLETFFMGVEQNDLRDSAMLVFISGIALATAIIVAIPVAAMLKGRAWGRSFYLLVVLLVPLAYGTGLVTSSDIADLSFAESASQVSHTLADFVAVLLLYTGPVNRWFDLAVEHRRRK